MEVSKSQTNIGSEIKFGSEKDMGFKEILGPKKFWVEKKFGSKNILGPKKIGVCKNLGSTKIVGHNFFFA